MPLKPTKEVKKTLKICHLADIHLGFRRFNKLAPEGRNQRELDINLAFEEAVERAIQIKPDITLIAGDLFHTVRPSNSVLTFCYRQIKKLARGTAAPIVITAGNHETPKRLDTGSALELLTEIEGVYVATRKPKRFEFKELNLAVTAVPQKSVEYTNIKTQDDYTYNILLMHGQTTGTKNYYGPAEIDLQKINTHEWDFIALGHVHEMEELNYNTFYAGAIEYTSNNIWQESEDKGFLEVDLPQKKVKFHKLSSPREVIDLDIIEGAALTAHELNLKIENALEGIPGGIEGKLVRLRVYDVARNVYKVLDHGMIRKYRVRAGCLIVDIKFASSSSYVVQSDDSKAMSLLEQLSSFVESEDLVDSEKTKNTLSKYFKAAQ